MKTALLLVSVLVVGCHGVTPRGSSAEDPRPAGSIVVIDRKQDSTMQSGEIHVRYAVDRTTHVCWVMMLGYSDPALSIVDCCAVRRIEAARRWITWESDASCSSLVAP